MSDRNTSTMINSRQTTNTKPRAAKTTLTVLVRFIGRPSCLETSLQIIETTILKPTNSGITAIVAREHIRQRIFSTCVGKIKSHAAQCTALNMIRASVLPWFILTIAPTGRLESKSVALLESRYFVCMSPRCMVRQWQYVSYLQEWDTELQKPSRVGTSSERKSACTSAILVCETCHFLHRRLFVDLVP
jgi:hypothetical protein